EDGLNPWPASRSSKSSSRMPLQSTLSLRDGCLQDNISGTEEDGPRPLCVMLSLLGGNNNWRTKSSYLSKDSRSTSRSSGAFSKRSYQDLMSSFEPSMA